MDMFIQQLAGLLLFVSIQVVAYVIYQRTQQTRLALLPHLVFLILTILLAILVWLFADLSGTWALVIMLVFVLAFVGIGLSVFISLAMIYFIKQRKNQPNNK
jgi:O-antigen/teichoic acid export membrane protein